MIAAIGIIGIVVLLTGMLTGARSVADSMTYGEDVDVEHETGCGWIVWSAILLGIGALLMTAAGGGL